MFKSIRPNDRVILGHRMWIVASVEYGGTNEEDAVELRCCDGISSIRILRVPLDLIPSDCIFRRVDHDEAKASAAA